MIGQRGPQSALLEGERGDARGPVVDDDALVMGGEHELEIDVDELQEGAATLRR
jgi:hypothetical protein